MKTRPRILSGEPPLSAFVSSVMTDEYEWARSEVVRALDRPPFMAPWAFEFTPASSERADATYLRKVRDADVVIWLVGAETTDPVRDEIREARSNNRPLLVFKLPAESRTAQTEEMLREMGSEVKWASVRDAPDLNEHVLLAIGDEIKRAFRRRDHSGRLLLLEELGRDSFARCLEKWLAVGVHRSLAIELAGDVSLGELAAELLPSRQDPLRVLVGDLGAGKSLAGERTLQRAIAGSLGSPGRDSLVHASDSETRQSAGCS